VAPRPGLHLPRLLEAPVRGKINAHHAWHWCDGGPTDLSNLALLCPRHHTIVHQKGHTATVTATGVTWHL
jgi:HNH endonuclease